MQLAEIPITQAIPEALVELWEERAAIMEYLGQLSREESEWQAFLFVCGEVEAMAQPTSEVQPHDP